MINGIQIHTITNLPPTIIINDHILSYKGCVGKIKKNENVIESK